MRAMMSALTGAAVAMVVFAITRIVPDVAGHHAWTLLFWHLLWGNAVFFYGIGLVGAMCGVLSSMVTVPSPWRQLWIIAVWTSIWTTVGTLLLSTDYTVTAEHVSRGIWAGGLFIVLQPAPMGSGKRRALAVAALAGALSGALLTVAAVLWLTVTHPDAVMRLSNHGCTWDQALISLGNGLLWQLALGCALVGMLTERFVNPYEPATRLEKTFPGAIGATLLFGFPIIVLSALSPAIVDKEPLTDVWQLCTLYLNTSTVTWDCVSLWIAAGISGLVFTTLWRTRLFQRADD